MLKKINKNRRYCHNVYQEKSTFMKIYAKYAHLQVLYFASPTQKPYLFEPK